MITLDMVSVKDLDVIVPTGYRPYGNIMSVGMNHTDAQPVRCVLCNDGTIRLRTANGGTPSGSKSTCVTFVYSLG